MLMLPPQMQVFASRNVTDLRKSFDGLVGIVEKELGQQIESGHLFLFFNRRRDRVKVLYFVGDGLVIWYKRLEVGTFEMPQSAGGTREDGTTAATPYLTMGVSELALILEGIDLSSVRRRKRWRRE